MNIFPSNVFCIYPTSVFFKKKHLITAIKKLRKYKSSFIFSAIKYPHPIQRSFLFKKNKLITNFPKFKKNSNTKIKFKLF